MVYIYRQAEIEMQALHWSGWN